MDITVLEIVTGKEEALEVDLNISVDTADKIWFTAKKANADDDADAILRKGRNGTSPYNAGITITDAATGKVKIQLSSADWPSDFVDEALVFDVQIKRASDTTPYPVVRGIIRCLTPITIVDS